MGSFTIRQCKSIVMASPEIRKLVSGWSDIPFDELYSERAYGNFLRRLVIRALKELC